MPKTIDSTDNLILIRAIQESGDVNAFRKLHEMYSPMVLGLSYKIVGNRELAEDITQETFWRVWHNASQFDAKRGNFASWMFGIARNLSIDALRKYKRVTHQPLFEEQTKDDDGPTEWLTGSDQDIADLAWSSVEKIQIVKAIKQLPEEQRKVVIWTFFQGKTRRQIAEEFDIPLGTVNTRAKLALKKLQTLLADLS